VSLSQKPFAQNVAFFMKLSHIEVLIKKKARLCSFSWYITCSDFHTIFWRPWNLCENDQKPLEGKELNRSFLISGMKFVLIGHSW